MDFELKELKKLPRDLDGEISRYFMANGVKYKICSVDEVMSPWRFTEWERLSIVAGFGLNFDNLFVRLKELEERIYSINETQSSKTPAILLLNGINNGLVNLGTSRWNQILMFATLFIVREGTSLNKWDADEANDDINNWNTEGYSLMDFFMLVALSLSGFGQKYTQLVREIQTLQAMGLQLADIK